MPEQGPNKVRTISEQGEDKVRTRRQGSTKIFVRNGPHGLVQVLFSGPIQLFTGQ
jgi:hypothetical protein